MHSIISPLVEKRINLLSIKKQMIGRRAYSESTFKTPKREISVSPPKSPVSPTQREIEVIAFNVSAC
jgi:hypothetical protein